MGALVAPKGGTWPGPGVCWHLWCVLDPLVPDQQGGPLTGSPEQVRFPLHTDLVLKERKG